MHNYNDKGNESNKWNDEFSDNMNRPIGRTIIQIIVNNI